MKVLILVHSLTGNTLKFAEAIKGQLAQKGNQTSLVQLRTDPPLEGKGKDPKDFRITNLPECSGYDIVLLGCPVWGFSPSPVAMKAVKEVKGLSGKRFMPFATQSFPIAALGGKRTLNVLSNEAGKKGARIVQGVTVQRMFHDIDKETKDRASKVPSLLG